jgi:lambda family phage portal protein
MNSIVPYQVSEGQRLNLFERGLSYVAPEYARDRAIARTQLQHITQFSYDAAYPGTARGWSGGTSKNAPSESIRAQTDRVRMMWDARDMERQFGLVVGVLDRTAQYVCQRVKYQPQTGHRGVDQKYSDYFEEWSLGADFCNKFTFQELVELGFRAMLRDGDCGFIKRYDNMRLKLQPIEGDRIGNPLQIGDPNERYISGVGIDDDGSPEFYRIFRRTRTAMYDKPQDIPASRFLHLYKPIRLDQYRGFTWFAAALPLVRDLYEIFRCERGAAKWASGFAGFKKVPDPFAGSGTTAWTARTAGNRGVGVDALIPDKIVNLGPGEDIIFPNMPDRPSGAFMQHVKAIHQQIAISLNLPYGFICDMSEFGSASARIETMQAQRSFQRFQQILIDRMLRECKNDVISGGIARGEIPAHPNWRKGRWNFGAHITADYGQWTQADLQLLAVGATTQHAMADAQGFDFEANVETSGSEAQAWYDQSVKRQLPLELINAKYQGATPLLAQMNGPTEQEEAEQQAAQPPPTIFQEVGDKGGMVILGAMEKVGQGIITHEAAVAFIAGFLGKSKEQVEGMIPPKGKPMPTAAPAAGGKKKSKPAGGFRTDAKRK